MSVEMTSQASQASQECDKCSFCKKIADDIKNAIIEKTHLKAFILSDFVVKPPFENPIHKDCECGRMFMSPPQDLEALKVVMLKILTPNPLERNACGCFIDPELSLCQRMNPFNCCGKCSKAIEKEKAIQERDMTKPFAIVVECSCHFKETVQPVICVKA